MLDNSFANTSKYLPDKSRKKLINIQRIEEFVRWYKRLPNNQKGSLVALAIIVFSVPASVVATLNEVRSRSQAYNPTSGQNPLPFITTTSLPHGVVNTSYEATIQAQDPNNTHPNLTLSATGLPDGLNVSKCSQETTSSSIITCQITGTPQKVGSFDVSITMKDDKGEMSQKIFWITIRPNILQFLKQH